MEANAYLFQNLLQLVFHFLHFDCTSMVETQVLRVVRVVVDVPKEVPNTTTKYLQGGNNSNHGISVEKWKIKIKNQLHPYKPQKYVEHLQFMSK